MRSLQHGEFFRSRATVVATQLRASTGPQVLLCCSVGGLRERLHEGRE